MAIELRSHRTDPRASLSTEELRQASLRAVPQVAKPARPGDGIGMALGLLGALALGALTLAMLSRERVQADESTQQKALQESAAASLPAVTPAQVQAVTAPEPPAPPSPNAVDPNQSRTLPMIVDNSGIAPSDGEGTKAAEATATPAATANGLNPDEQFALRVGNDEPPVQYANALAHPGDTLVQGTIIPAVLETALNSELPGFVRAIVSRDVRSFDGARVVVPRGSRLVGQYKSGMATGQSRAYIMWVRLIRPDGVSVQLSSPAMGEGGEIGLSGEVNRHFWQRFGASIMLSIVGGAAGSLGDSDSGTIVVGTSANSAAAMALETDGKISPTIRIPLGTPVQVFVARDMDFSGY